MSKLLHIVAPIVVLLLCGNMKPVEASYGENVTCVLRPEDFTEDQLQGILAYCCGDGGVDCVSIQPGHSHFYPNTTRDHVNWAMNAYFQMHRANGEEPDCDFSGAAQLQCPQNTPEGLATKERIIGANIGGFLVLEPWIVPKLFDQFVGKPDNETAIDEYTFAKVLGKEEATKQLTAHWNSWVQKSDFEKLVEMGVTHIRVPYGYWIFGDVEPFVKGIEQLDRTLDLAKEVGLKVLLDLHGALGSQNGFDNSGRACEIGGQPCAIPCPAHASWGRQGPYDITVNSTLVTLQRIAERYKNHSAVWGMELINEPRAIELATLKNFYTRGYNVVRQYGAPNWKVVIHDGFYPNVWRDFLTPNQGYHGVYLDNHIYQAFVPYGGDQTFPEHLETSCEAAREVDYQECHQLPTIVGEWSLATTDCTQWLDGYDKAAKSEYCATRPPNKNVSSTFLKKYAEYQISSYYRGHGWFFWNFKTAASPEWDLIHAWEQGWLPSFKETITTTNPKTGQPTTITGLSKGTIEACNFSKVN